MEPGRTGAETIWEVLHRQKDIQYSSRVATHIARQAQIHRLRHVIKELAHTSPKKCATAKRCAALASYGCLTRMHFVRLLSPRFDNEDHTKDIDFQPRRHPPALAVGLRDDDERHRKRALER